MLKLVVRPNLGFGVHFECKSSSLFTRIVNVLWLKLIIKIISPHHASLAELVQQLSSEQ